MDALTTLLVLFNLLIFLPLEIYALVRGINVQRYTSGIAKGTRYKQGFWWRQATALAKSRQAKGTNFIVTTVLAALGVVLAIVNGSILDGAICGYILASALVTANFFATQLPIIEAKQNAAATTGVQPS